MFLLPWRCGSSWDPGCCVAWDRTACQHPRALEQSGISAYSKHCYCPFSWRMNCCIPGCSWPMKICSSSLKRKFAGRGPKLLVAKDVPIVAVPFRAFPIEKTHLHHLHEDSFDTGFSTLTICWLLSLPWNCDHECRTIAKEHIITGRMHLLSFHGFWIDMAGLRTLSYHIARSPKISWIGWKRSPPDNSCRHSAPYQQMARQELAFIRFVHSDILYRAQIYLSSLRSLGWLLLRKVVYCDKFLARNIFPSLMTTLCWSTCLRSSRT